MKHINIPIFVPHLGCPHNCVFCNQKTITGNCGFDINSIEKTVDDALSSIDFKKTDVQIAFFGGSFTGIERSLMTEILSRAEKYVKIGAVSSLRLSTRPDYINAEILGILSEYSVKTIELGIQSTSDRVLLASGRGHTAEDSKNASLLIKKYGFELVGQMMIGLPLSDLPSEIKTAEDIVKFGADAARIYPTVVFADTALEMLTLNGKYQPLEIKDAAKRSAKVYKIFNDNSVDVIRIGLCETDGLRSEKKIGGAYHPALGELCMNEFYLLKITEKLAKLNLTGVSEIEILTAPRTLSQAIGQKKCNLTELSNKYPNIKITFSESITIPSKNVEIKIKEK